MVIGISGYTQGVKFNVIPNPKIISSATNNPFSSIYCAIWFLFSVVATVCDVSRLFSVKVDLVVVSVLFPCEVVSALTVSLGSTFDVSTILTLSSLIVTVTVKGTSFGAKHALSLHAW